MVKLNTGVVVKAFTGGPDDPPKTKKAAAKILEDNPFITKKLVTLNNGETKRFLTIKYYQQNKSEAPTIMGLEKNVPPLLNQSLKKLLSDSSGQYKPVAMGKENSGEWVLIRLDHV